MWVRQELGTEVTGSNYCCDGTKACGNTAGMELITAEKSAGVYSALGKITKSTLCHDNNPWSSGPQGPHYTTIMKPSLKLPSNMAEDSLR